MPVFYEWDVEEVDECGDVVEHNHFKTYSEAFKCFNKLVSDAEYGMSYEIVLVRNSDKERSWAYIEDGILPTHFEDAYGIQTAKVPSRFFKRD